MPRGGHRPGAGAPKGNVNGLKHGLYSPRFHLGALIIAAVPELRFLFDALQLESARKERKEAMAAISAAYRIVLNDPEMAESIKQLVRDRMRDALKRVQRTETQSSNQTT
jgi:hypothetical protein